MTVTDDRLESTDALLRLAQAETPDEALRLQNVAIEKNLGLAGALSRRFRGRGPSPEDLEQVAYLALVKAVRRFDPDRGSFIGYATPTILGELKKYFRDSMWTIRPPRRIQDLQSAIVSNAEELRHRSGIEPSLEQIALGLNASVTEVREAQSARSCYRARSLDATYDEELSTLLDCIGITDVSYERVETFLSLEPVVRVLSGSDRQILWLRFFEVMTQQQIAEAVGLSQMAVSRRIKHICAGLRAAMADDTRVA